MDLVHELIIDSFYLEVDSLFFKVGDDVLHSHIDVIALLLERGGAAVELQHGRRHGTTTTSVVAAEDVDEGLGFDQLVGEERVDLFFGEHAGILLAGCGAGPLLMRVLIYLNEARPLRFRS